MTDKHSVLLKANWEDSSRKVSRPVPIDYKFSEDLIADLNLANPDKDYTHYKSVFSLINGFSINYILAEENEKAHWKKSLENVLGCGVLDISMDRTVVCLDLLRNGISGRYNIAYLPKGTEPVKFDLLKSE